MSREKKNLEKVAAYNKKIDEQIDGIRISLLWKALLLTLTSTGIIDCLTQHNLSTSSRYKISVGMFIMVTIVDVLAMNSDVKSIINLKDKKIDLDRIKALNELKKYIDKEKNDEIITSIYKLDK